MVRTVLVTDGAGFIGLAVVRETIQYTADRVVVMDKLTYAGSLMSLALVAQDAHLAFEQVDICDRGELDHTFRQHQPDTAMHLAAEGHVDRSINGPAALTETNILDTHTLLEVARSWWNTLATEKEPTFRFHHISTDEMYGDLHGSEDFFTEITPYVPSSPYLTSKVSSDHLVYTWLRTYGLPMLITNCFNNCGPCHFPEKLIPLTILNAPAGKSLPVYGSGQQIRDWLHVEDYVGALYLVATRDELGEACNIGGHDERKGIEVVETICQLLEELAPHKPQSTMYYRDLITFIVDHPGHDLRYAIDASKIARELGWVPTETFTFSMCKTVTQYLASESWWHQVQDGNYQGERLGLQN